jgi:hypothetical protein
MAGFTRASNPVKLPKPESDKRLAPLSQEILEAEAVLRREVPPANRIVLIVAVVEQHDDAWSSRSLSREQTRGNQSRAAVHSATVA